MNPFIPKSSRSKKIKKVYPKTFWIEESSNPHILNSSRSKKIEKVYSKVFGSEDKTNFHILKCQKIKDKTNQKPYKLFRIEVERTKLILYFSRSKWNEPNRSKTFHDRCGMNQIVPTKTFQDRSGTNQNVPKLFKIIVKRSKLFQKVSMLRWNKVIGTVAGMASSPASYMDKRQRGFDGCTGPG